MFVFVYGTLKKGFYNHEYMNSKGDHAIFIQVATISGKMYDLGAYPAINLVEERLVHGEVYEISSNILKQLDYLEGYPDLYSRTMIRINDEIQAWVYHMEYSRLKIFPRIDTGFWNKK